MIIFVNGQKITINPKSDYLAAGGEGTLYLKGSTVYKIATALPKQKMLELSALTDPRVIKPEQPILDNNGKEIGYTMSFVKGDELCRLFTKSFKDRNAISNDNILATISNFRSLIEHIHSKKILVVDLNEFNFLYRDKIIYGIDTNSYMTKSYPATVIMPSVRDFHSKTFTDMTDWYSWGIVTLQMIIGIHPYKGTHPKYTGPLLDKMRQRALDNVSIFNKNVSIPDICDLDIIPIGLKNWYIDIFEHRKRTLPPINFDSIVKKTEVKIIKSSETLNFTDKNIIIANDDKIRQIQNIGNMLVIIGEKHTYINKQVLPRCDHVLFCQGKPLLIAGNKFYYDKFCGHIDLAHIEKIISKNDLLLVTENDIIKATFTPIGTTVILSYEKICGHLPSVKYGDGCILENTFGEWSVLPEEKKLLGLSGSIVDCKRIDDHLVMIISDIINKGIYKTYYYNLNSNDPAKEIDSYVINFTVYNNIVIIVTNQGLLLFNNKGEKLILNHGLKNSKITSCGDMYAYTDKHLYKISIK